MVPPLDPGWYVSPPHMAAHGRPAGTVLRYWDGIAWTHHVAEADRPAPGQPPTEEIRLPPTKGT